MISYLQAIIIGLFQGITELFPVSSLGHSVLISYLFRWNSVLHGTIDKTSSFLLFLVVVHVATALALFFYYRKKWYRIIGAWLKSIKDRSMEGKDAKLAWFIIVATIPAALTGLILQSLLQSQFAKPLSAAIFITLNGIMLLYGDRVINKRVNYKHETRGNGKNGISDNLDLKKSVLIGFSQIGALFAGISRSGITMIGGVLSGLNREDAAEFSFLLATPVILGAGLYKLPTVISTKSAGIHGQMLVGAICAGIAAYLSVRFLDKYFKKSSYKPFGFYCIAVGLAFILLYIVRGMM